jgi:hypothetical protein
MCFLENVFEKCRELWRARLSMTVMRPCFRRWHSMKTPHVGCRTQPDVRDLVCPCRYPVAASLGNSCPFLDERKILYGGTFRGTCLRSVDRISNILNFQTFEAQNPRRLFFQPLLGPSWLCCYAVVLLWGNKIHHADWLTSSGVMGGTSAPTSMEHTDQKIAYHAPSHPIRAFCSFPF